MRINISLFLILFSCSVSQAQFVVTEVGTLPESVSNNAVCEGFIEGVPYLFSFSGIDSTKEYSGIHLKSYRFNIETGESERIADLPDDLGKIGVAASRIGNIIYIAGGYNVFADGSEKTTGKMHRYDIENNQFLTDAADIPVPTDDHVQVVWRDSLIYLITGWKDAGNIPDVQIYNPVSDTWTMGTSVPDLDTYKSFGASGTIVDDKIYYFGGARSVGSFGIQPNLRIGTINPEQPTQIDWEITVPDFQIFGYRMAATSVNDQLHWIGGSNKTYNYDGIAYNNTGPAPPNKRDLYLTTSELEWKQRAPIEVPMDLRGIANISNTIKYIAGGMIDNQKVTNKVYRLEWMDLTNVNEEISDKNIIIGPNPFSHKIEVSADETIGRIDCYSINGELIFSEFPNQKSYQIDCENLEDGMYLFRIEKENNQPSRQSTTPAKKTVIRKLIKVSN